jgi:peroxiredoxin
VLNTGDPVPHFDVTTVDGAAVRYATIWQRRNLVLVTLGHTTAASRPYADAMASRADEFASHAAACVITQDPIVGLPAPGVLVADRWGEVVYAMTGADIRELPSPQDLIEWLEYVEQRCPECEGEAR